MRACGSEYSRKFVLFTRLRSADRPATPVVVQPGAPGKPTRTLPSTMRAKLPPASPADVQFMQGMIMHHAQAVEMTALIESHTENKDLRSLGARISRSQSDEIKLMKRWLAAPWTANFAGDARHVGHENVAREYVARVTIALMPGMLTPAQMEALRKARGEEFDRLFLTGMIQRAGVSRRGQDRDGGAAHTVPDDRTYSRPARPRRIRRHDRHRRVVRRVRARRPSRRWRSPCCWSVRAPAGRPPRPRRASCSKPALKASTRRRGRSRPRRARSPSGRVDHELERAVR